MRRTYWLMVSLMVLVVSLGCGCSVLKPERTVVRDAEAGQALENQVILEPEAATAAESSIEGAQASDEPAGDVAPATSSNDGTGNTDSSTSGDEAETPVVKDSGDQASTASSPASSGAADSVTIGKDQTTVETASDTVPSLITKSENAVTEAERIELFNTIGFELDELIRLLDSLDTVQESDLNLDEFEE